MGIAKSVIQCILASTSIVCQYILLCFQNAGITLSQYCSYYSNNFLIKVLCFLLLLQFQFFSFSSQFWNFLLLPLLLCVSVCLPWPKVFINFLLIFQPLKGTVKFKIFIVCFRILSILYVLPILILKIKRKLLVCGKLVLSKVKDPSQVTVLMNPGLCISKVLIVFLCYFFITLSPA